MERSPRSIDVRYWQASAQLLFIFYAGFAHNYWPSFVGALGCFFSALFFHHLSRLEGKAEKNWLKRNWELSVLNSTLSLTILLRCHDLTLWLFAGALLFFVRRLSLKSGHLFNPSNFVIVFFLVFFSDRAWIAPGLWAREGLFILFILSLGLFVNKKAHVLTASLSFLLTTFLLYFGRGVGLGEPLGLVWHNLQNGAFFIFTFFTLTDPRTIGKNLPMQIINGILLASLAFVIDFGLFIRGPWFYALFGVNLLCPLVEFLFFKNTSPQFHESTIKEALYEGS